MGQEMIVVENDRFLSSEALAQEIVGYRAEMDAMRARLCRLEQEDTAEVMSILSGIAGRLAEMRSSLIDRNLSAATSFCSKQIDPLRKDLEFHFQCWSRRLATMEWELKMSGGAP